MSKIIIKPKTKSIQKKFKSFRSIFSSYWILGLLSIPFIFSIYLIYYAFSSDQQFVPFSMVALIGGLIYESYRITQSYEKILIYSVISYVISLFAFAPHKNETIYSLEVHFHTWIYLYLIIYLLIFVVEQRKKTTASIGEGISFLFYLAFVYWLYEHHLLNVDHIFTQILSALIVGYSIFALFHAFSQIPHRAMSRLLLSIATSIVIFILCISNIRQLYDQGDLSLDRSASENIILSIQYFFLGTSAIYIFQNMMLLLAFMPSKYSRIYIKDFKEAAQNHIDRFSDAHISFVQASLCFVISTMAYTFNAYFQLLNPNSMIWLVILICPIILQYLDPIEVSPVPIVQKSKINSNRNKRRKKRN